MNVVIIHHILLWISSAKWMVVLGAKSERIGTAIQNGSTVLYHQEVLSPLVFPYHLVLQAITCTLKRAFTNNSIPEQYFFLVDIDPEWIH